MAVSSLNWVYDVFLSFRGEDVRVTFRSHLLKELDRKLITVFKDNEIERSHSLWPELVQAIKNSRIAVVVFSQNYASSSWCLNELLEIVNCKDKIVIPIFYGLDPFHVRKQTGDFGKIFEVTCKNNTDEVINLWKKALTDVANMLGFHSVKWDDEAKMIEAIASDVLRKLLSSSSKDLVDCVGIEDHIANMSEMLQLESEEVRMVGICGSSGIGKTTIARALFNQLSRHFQVCQFIDRGFVYKSKEIYSGANPDDHNMKLHLQEKFLSGILGMEVINIDHLGALGERLKHHKVLIIIDDLDDQMVLDSLVAQPQWFGNGSRIIVVTNDRHFLTAHRIDHIYEVNFPTEERAREMLCQSAFRQKYPHDGFEKLVVEVTRHAGNLPLGLNVLGSYLRGRDKEYWMDMLPRLQNGLDDKIEKILRISYNGLGSKEDKAVFRHIACLFNHVGSKDIKLFLGDSGLSVNIALQNLADKSLIHVSMCGHVEMHHSLEEIGRKIVCTESIDEPGKREFLVDSKDSCYILSDGIGTEKVLGISLDTSEIDDELHVSCLAFKRMRNLRFLKIYSREGRLHLPESFDYLPSKLKLLSWDRYPMSYLPSTFHPESLVKLQMRNSKLKKLWEGVVSLTCLKELDLLGSDNLEEVPDLSLAANLETLNLEDCGSLVELPSSIRNLNKLLKLYMGFCQSLKALPTGFNLKSLDYINFSGCSQLKTFPEFSTNISVLNLEGTNIENFPSDLRLENLVELAITKENHYTKQQNVVTKPLTPFMAMLPPTLTTLDLAYIQNLVEIPSSFQNLNQLKELSIHHCINLKTLPTGINLKSLDALYLFGCSRVRRFPNISTNISKLGLEQTGIEMVPWWIENFSNLTLLRMRGCSRLICVSPCIFKLKHLDEIDFSECGTMSRVVALSGFFSKYGKKADNIDIVPEDASSFLFDDHVPKAKLNFRDCFKLDQNALLQQSPKNLVKLKMRESKVEKLWEGVLSLTCLKELDLLGSEKLKEIPDLSLATNLETLVFERCKSLVELPSSVQNLNKLNKLDMRFCINLETLPKGINLKSLSSLNLYGCNQLRSFPEISTNISYLELSKTAIDEVPWQINNFSSLIRLRMSGCSRLQCVSLHISRLKHLEEVDFSYCGVLTRVDLGGYISKGEIEPDNVDTVSKEASSSLSDYYIPKAKLNCIDCFNLDEDALFRQQSISFKTMVLPGKEVSSYFTHHTESSSSLTIPIFHAPLFQPFYRFRICAVVTPSIGVGSGTYLKVNCKFKGRFWNIFDSSFEVIVGKHSSRNILMGRSYMSIVLDCLIPLNKDDRSLAQRNYDQVEMQIDVSYGSPCNVIEWGIRLLDDNCLSPENRLGKQNTLPCVEDSMGYMPLQGFVNETEHNDESGDSYAETERSKKRIRLYNFV